MTLENKLSNLRAVMRPLYITTGTNIGDESITWPTGTGSATYSGSHENTGWYAIVAAQGPSTAAKGLVTVKASWEQEFDLSGLRNLLIAPVGNAIQEPEPPAMAWNGYSYMRDYEFWTTAPVDVQEMRDRIASPYPAFPHQDYGMGAGSEGALISEEQFLFGNVRTYGSDSGFTPLIGFQRMIQQCNFSEGEIAACPKIYYYRIVYAYGDANNNTPIPFIDFPSRISAMGIATVEPESDIAYLAQLQRSTQAPKG